MAGIAGAGCTPLLLGVAAGNGTCGAPSVVSFSCQRRSASFFSREVSAWIWAAFGLTLSRLTAVPDAAGCALLSCGLAVETVLERVAGRVAEGCAGCVRTVAGAVD